MYYPAPVKIPDLKGKIFIKSKNSALYVQYQYGSEYKPEKKYAVPQRTIIGKVCSDDKTLMYPNEHFSVYFPDAELPGASMPEGLSGVPPRQPEEHAACQEDQADAVTTEQAEDDGLPQDLPQWEPNAVQYAFSEGVSQGRKDKEKEVLQGLAQDIISELEARFGSLPEELTAAIQAVPDWKKLAWLLRLSCQAGSLDEFTSSLQAV